jgi:(E)-4-hydroxy-3-methylbut-2-enyl-diphosphate synthase
MSYCASRFQTLRRPTVEVRVGAVGVGGGHPLRIQSMTTSDTQDVDATVRQCIALAEVGCELVRVTAPHVAAARCLRAIRERFTAAGFGGVPLVADIHFLPAAALEAVEHVEKVRINPGNYADKKKFAVREYTDAEYDGELQRLAAAGAPLVRRCRELGRALRIGTNHGSLSDRILNRYGDTPLGMVESALEFVRIAEAEGFHDLILSMKASNPKVMIQAYRLLAVRLDAAHRPYPLHLGVTEAGDGEDGRIKGAIGIGSLLWDGLGDTIRVSLTEDSVYEIPVARALAERAMHRWPAAGEPPRPAEAADAIDPFHFARRDFLPLDLSDRCRVGPELPPRVIVGVPGPDHLAGLAGRLPALAANETPVEGLLIPVADAGALAAVRRTLAAVDLPVEFLVLDLAASVPLAAAADFAAGSRGRLVWCRRFAATEAGVLAAWAGLARRQRHLLAIDLDPAAVPALAETLRALGGEGLLATATAPGTADGHPLGTYRRLAEHLRVLGLRIPLWIRNTAAHARGSAPDFLGRLLDASIVTGGLLCDGLGDLVSVETEADPVRAAQLAYNVLQGAGARVSKTEFVACPSCGRTLFDLQTTTQRIRRKTGHLQGVKIAIMGCIVNGPGEMADADFGYVGGAPGRINLYVGRNCVQYNLPPEEADERLLALIRAHGKWREPGAAHPVVTGSSLPPAGAAAGA